MTAATGGPSPRPSESSSDVDLFGATTSGRPRRRAWRIELEGIGEPNAISTYVRVTMVDSETGRRSAARVPFSWIVDVGASGGRCAVTIEEGTYS